jgi:hypothetical protein
VEDNSFTQPAKTKDPFPLYLMNGRIHRAEQEGTRQTDPLEGRGDNPSLEGFDIHDYIGEFRHTNADHGTDMPPAQGESALRLGALEIGEVDQWGKWKVEK